MITTLCLALTLCAADRWPGLPAVAAAEGRWDGLPAVIATHGEPGPAKEEIKTPGEGRWERRCTTGGSCQLVWVPATPVSARPVAEPAKPVPTARAAMPAQRPLWRRRR